jgi:hypothetical protein
MLKKILLTMLTTVVLSAVFARGVTYGHRNVAGGRAENREGCIGRCARIYNARVAECNRLPPNPRKACIRRAKQALAECKAKCHELPPSDMGH